MRSALAATGMAALLAACNVPIGHFTVIGRSAPADAPRTALVPARGCSCRWWVLGVPLGLPRIDDAVADALAGTGGETLVDADLVSVHPVYGPVGRHCFVVTGRAMRVDADGGRP